MRTYLDSLGDSVVARVALATKTDADAVVIGNKALRIGAAASVPALGESVRLGRGCIDGRAECSVAGGMDDEVLIGVTREAASLAVVE